MRIVDKSNYEKYLADNEVNSAWKKRDFVSDVIPNFYRARTM